MYAKVYGETTCGINGEQIIVEVDISNGLPSFDIVGLPDTSVKESRERPDSVDIILDAGHQFSGVGFVKIIRAQRLYMGKKILSHISCDGRANPVKSELFGIAEHTAAGAHNKDTAQQVFQDFNPPAYDNIIDNMLCELW